MRSFVIALVLISALLPSSVRAQARCGASRSRNLHQRLFRHHSVRPREGARSCGRAHGAGRRVRGAARLRSRAPGFRRGHPHRPDVREGVRQSRRGATERSRISTRPSTTSRGVLTLEPRSAHAFADRAGMHRLNGQARCGDSRLHRGDSHRPRVRRGDSEPRHHAGRHRRSAPTRSPISPAPSSCRIGTGTEPGAPIALVDRGVCYEKTGPRRSGGEGLLRAPRRWSRARSMVSSFAARCISGRGNTIAPRRLRAGARRQSELGDRAIWTGHGEAHDR